MGTIHAKEPASHNTEENYFGNTNKKESNGLHNPQRLPYMNQEMDTPITKPQATRTKPIDLQGIKARVDKIHVDGLIRTKDDIVKAQVTELFKAGDFQDVIVRAHKVRGKLESIGCFKNIGVYIDASDGPDASPEGVEVTFTVHEMTRLMGGINTMVGNNEGSIMVGARAPNIFGRGERLQMEYSYGSKNSTNFNVSAVKPFVDDWLNSVLTATVFSSSNDFPWSGYKQSNTGALLDFAFFPHGLGGLKHNIQYEAAIRDLSISKQVSFDVREQCGPTLKSALRHICQIDKRDGPIFPKHGSLIQFTTEVAGLGGDIGFIKNELALQTNWTLRDYFTFQMGLQSGLLRNISNDFKVSIADRFFLGGPLSLRGFDTRGCGPRSDGNSLGGNIYWALGLHLYTPLPFRPGRSGFGDLFRLHGFINSGNISDCAFKFSNSYEENIKIFTENIRCTSGVGIAMKLGNIARVEFNVITPLKYSPSDIFRQFQFGIGLQYL